MIALPTVLVETRKYAFKGVTLVSTSIVLYPAPPLRPLLLAH